MYNHFNGRSGQKAPLIADDVYEIIMKNAAFMDSEIIYDRDFDYDYFGFKTLERSCLLKVSGKVVELPQHMLMRVATGIHKDDIDSVLTYRLMSHVGSPILPLPFSMLGLQDPRCITWNRSGVF